MKKSKAKRPTFPVNNNGALAQADGHPSGNNPFNKGSMEYYKWQNEWKEAYKSIHKKA